MATTTTINSSFVGKDAGMYIAAAMKESKSLNELTIMDNVKYKAIVKSLVGADFVQDESCDFTPTGTLTLSEKVITPKNLKLNLQLCKQDLLSACADAIPSTVLGKEDLCIFLNQKHYRNYIHKMSELGYIDRFNMSADYTPVFEGIKLCVVDGMPNDQLVAARRSNLFFGTDLVGDQSSLKMLDMADIDGSDNIRVICKYTAGTQIGIGSEIVHLS